MRADGSPAGAAPRPGAQSITVVRTFAAPVAEVFDAWTDPDRLRRWLAPGPCVVAEASADPRPGGLYRILTVDPLGARHLTTGEYREVVPGERLVKTWVYEGPAHRDRYPTLLTVDFREAGPDATEVTLRQDRLVTHEDREGNREGWRLCFDKLDALLAHT